jgi:hypothetical protein
MQTITWSKASWFQLTINHAIKISYVMTATNKRLLIFESRGGSNWCTLYRGKPDQHETYASHASPRTSGVRFLWQSPYVATFHKSSTELDRVTAPKKKCSWHNPQHAGWPIHESVPSFSPKPTNEAVEKHKTSINNRLLGLLGPYHWHAIDTFNTCSWGPTERSLIDIGRSYNLRGVGLPRTHSPTFRISCPHFPLVAPLGL